jgi:hypothetical protein
MITSDVCCEKVGPQAGDVPAEGSTHKVIDVHLIGLVCVRESKHGKKREAALATGEKSMAKGRRA